MRVLYAGSSAEDMRLAGKQLARVEPAVTLDFARTPEEFAIQLDVLSYNLVLAELHSPDWPDDSALRIWKRRPGSGPFILVVSAADENQALECVKRGATDYVLKTNLERLPLVIWKEQHHSIRAKEACEAANRAKSELLSNVSYELRASMSGIIGMTDLALETQLTPVQREYLGIVKQSAESLLTALSKLFEISNIEKGEFRLNEIPFDLHDNLAEALRQLATAAHQKGLDLLLDIRPAAPRFVRGDPAQLLQILSHLVGNAVKFTESGEILLQADLESENEEGVLMRFMVFDTGIGIPGERRQILFDASSRSPGTGLGLTIASRLVSAMGGRIWVDSEPGRGSRFHFTARFKRPKES
jgi:signal transduction histidine kinase